MSYTVNGTTISLTRGDTFHANIVIEMPGSKEPYIPSEGDRIRFAMKKTFNDSEPLILKEIPLDSLILTIESEETKPLDFGSYIYDMELTTAAGEVTTFITKAKFILTEEVH